MQLLLSFLCFLTLSQQHESQKFGIGFDFTPGYATSAISYPNGSNIALVRVNGGNEWKELMTRTCFDPDSLGGGSWSTTSASITMANMLRSLISASEERLGHDILAATVNMPSRDIGARGSTPVTDLVRKAFSIVDLEYLQIVRYSFFGEPLLYSENTILAAHNLSLCHPYTVTHNYCLRPGHPELPEESYYMVGYYADALEVTETSPTALAYGITPYPYMDHQLGESTRHRNPDEAFYWEQVRRLLSTPLLKHIWRPTKVVLYGDRSSDPHLRQVIVDVLRAFLDEDKQPEWINDDVDPVFAAAMGAAEFAKRKPFWESTQSALEPSPSHKADL